MRHGGATLHKVENPFKRKLQKFGDKYSKNTTEFAKEIKWEIIPGAKCEACNKSNHNVYKTGCPSLAVFCACKDFYDKTPKDKLKPVLKAFEEYQTELRKKLRQRRNNDRCVLRAVAHEVDDKDMTKLQDTLMDAYVKDHADKQYLESNPYHILEEEPETE